MSGIINGQIIKTKSYTFNLSQCKSIVFRVDKQKLLTI